MVRVQLAWAITHGMTERVHLLVSHGADVASPFDDGATTTSMAATTWHPDLVGYLGSQLLVGAPRAELDPGQNAEGHHEQPGRKQDVHDKAEDGQGHDGREDEGDDRDHGDRSPFKSQR
jgi:hypothetical protein